MKEQLQCKLLNEIHAVTMKYINTIRVDDIVSVVLKYAMISALATNNDIEAMEMIRDALNDAVQIKRNHGATHDR